MDVTSLFTNIPLDLAITGLTSRWPLIERNTRLSFDEFIKAVKFVLSSTYFTFNHTIYRQTYGMPMGSPLSPIIADLVMQDVEEKVSNSLDYPVTFYFRYVDDIILAAPAKNINEILRKFNNYHERLKFTIEYENNRCLSFLDLNLMVNDDTIIIDWYHKKTFSDRYLSYFSNHPMNQKLSTIYGRQSDFTITSALSQEKSRVLYRNFSGQWVSLTFYFQRNHSPA